MQNIKFALIKLIRPYGKVDFISNLPKGSKILDVGCGNNSPYRTKKILPDCIYTGIDVGDYNQTHTNCADSYIVTSPEKFSEKIYSLPSIFDAVISAHNLEHCNNRESTLLAMLNCLRAEGRIYLSFPSDKSISLPSRGGTLNYFDDPTHKDVPPDFDLIIKRIISNNFHIIYANRYYKTRILESIGRLINPLSKKLNKTLTGTWELHGFESIIIAQKNAN